MISGVFLKRKNNIFLSSHYCPFRGSKQIASVQITPVQRHFSTHHPTQGFATLGYRALTPDGVWSVI
jgi:hypothetical protein